MSAEEMIFGKVLDRSSGDVFVLAVTSSDLLYLEGAARRLRLLNELIPDEAVAAQLEVLDRIIFRASSVVRVAGDA